MNSILERNYCVNLVNKDSCEHDYVPLYCEARAFSFGTTVVSYKIEDTNSNLTYSFWYFFSYLFRSLLSGQQCHRAYHQVTRMPLHHLQQKLTQLK